MQKAILLSLVVIGLISSVVGVGTYAYFSDTETANGNTITAGTLDLTLGGVTPFSITDMKPSYHKQTDWVRLNFQSNPAAVYKRIASIVCTPQAGLLDPRDKECGYAGDPADPAYVACINQKMTNYMWFDLSIWKDGQEQVLIPDEKVAVKTVDEFNNPPSYVEIHGIGNHWLYLGTYQPGVELPVKESFHMMDRVTNWAQGQTCTINEEYMILQDNAPYPTDCRMIAAGGNDIVPCVVAA